MCVYASPCVLKSWLQNQFIQTTTTSFSRQINETLSMIHGSFPALFLSCTADRTEAFSAANMDLQCILCIVNSSSAVKTPKDEVTCDTYWNFYKKLKILTFPSKRDISRSNVRMGDNFSKRESPVQNRRVGTYGHNSLAGTDHWNSNLSTNIQCEENNHSAFLIFQKICKKINKINYISDIFWTFKSKLQIIHGATYIALFLPDSSKCFFICLVPYIHICLYHFLILCSYFYFLVFLFTPWDTFYNLQCLIWFHYNLSVMSRR